MTEPRKHPERDQIASDFDYISDSYGDQINDVISFGGNEHKFYVDVKRDHLIKIVEQEFGPSDDLVALDLGCGIGVYHDGLLGCFKELHATDISANSIQRAKEANPWVKYLHHGAQLLPYQDETFDVVFAICVMHHVPPNDWGMFTQEIYRTLKPGGIALIFEHNPYNPATQYIVRSCEIDKDAVLLRPGKLRSIFAQAGFKRLTTRTILSVPPKGTFLTRADALLGYLPFGAQYYLSAIK